MAEYGVLKDGRLWVGGKELTGDMNSIALAEAVEAMPDARYGDDTRVEKPGLFTGRLEAAGYFNATTVDVAANTYRGLAEVPVTFGLLTGAEQEICYMMRAMVANYTIGGPVGEQLPFTVSAGSSGGDQIVRGIIMQIESAQGSSVNGPVIQYGAMGAAERCISLVHVTQLSGTSLDYNLKSDDNGGMSSPGSDYLLGNLLNGDVASGLGYDWDVSAVDPNTGDDYWRSGFSLNGGGTFAAIIAMGFVTTI